MQCDLELVRRWLSHCECKHADSCHHSPIGGPSKSGFGIRFIDINRKCIVKAPQGARYIALSYVWGKARQLHLTQSSVDELMTDGAITTHYHRLPSTVRDALTLCARLGERYLWVDTLCIVQDSPHDKMWQINRMGKIYSGATLTVVAATGDDADAGLPRLSQNLKPMAPHQNFQSAMASCKWETRGWTFQEKVLSVRLLVFTENQLYFSCRRATWSEDGIADPGFEMEMCAETHESHLEKKDESTIPAASLDADLERYTRLVEEYSTRTLTHQGDALNAFVGILDIFTRIRDKSTTFTYGLPVAAFDYAFCWSAASHAPDLRRPEFPSWSWLGWRQKVSFDHPIRQRGMDIYTSRLIKATEQDVNGAFESFKSSTLYPRSWGDFSHSANVMFEASAAMLQVSREEDSEGHAGAATELFEVLAPNDAAVVYGRINLDRSWRRQRPDKLLFIVVRVAELEGVQFITHLMCVDRVGDRAFRVNLMEGPCMIPVEMWNAARPSTTLISLF